MGITSFSFTSILLLIGTVLFAKLIEDFIVLKRQHNEEQDSLEILKRYPERIIDEMCSEKFFDCYLIADMYDNKTERPLAFRVLRLKGHGGFLQLSKARLLIPQPMSYKTLDTRKWELDKTTVRLRYARMMISGIFFSEAVEYNSPKVSNVLMFGLGGGVINNYLTTMPGQKFNVTVVDIDPVMKRIAEKWYGFEETDMHRIIVEDGVEFINKDQGVKYDAILVDVSDTDMKPLICPIQSFLKDDLISNLYYNLADTGVVIVNIITAPSFIQAGSELVLKRFEGHFNFCVLLPTSSFERMLFCFKRKPWNNDPNKLHEHVMKMDRELGFHLKDGGKYESSDKW